jgi:PBP1b-binding outer membrane lipoprotein LpoB
MRYSQMHPVFLAILSVLFSIVFFTGCDSGKETIDAVTGNQAVKQYHKSEKDIQDIADKQSERLGSIPEDNEDEEKDDEE